MPVDRTRVSFAEAEGKIRFPSILQWGELDDRLRATLWNAVLPFFDKHVGESGIPTLTTDGLKGRSQYESPLREILLREFVERRHGFRSDFIERYPSKGSCLNDWAGLFRSADYVELFDFITHVLRDKECPKTLIIAVRRALKQPWSPYQLITSPPTIVPAISRHQAASIERDTARVFASRFEGSQTHLQAAFDSLNKGNHRDVIREAIHAVESAVRDFTGDEKAVLSKALRKLASDYGTHRALSDAFEKLYAYASDENGIRHSLVFGKNERVGVDEAIFFVSASAAFVAYLAQKASTAHEGDSDKS